MLLAALFALISAPILAVDPEEIYNKALEASAAVRSYEAEVYDSSRFFGVARYTIRQQLSEHRKDVGFAATPTLSSGTLVNREGVSKPIGLSFDGSSTCMMLDPLNKTVIRFDNPTPKTMGIYSGRLGYPYVGAIPYYGFENMRKLWSDGNNEYEALADANINGDECYAIAITRKLTTPDGQEIKSKNTYLISKKDYMIRGVRGTGFMKTFKYTKLNDHYPLNSFTLPIPDGFTVKDANNEIPSDRTLLLANVPAPEFSLKDPDGHNVSLNDLKGKVVLLDFWGVWCGPCRKSMPKLQELHEKYKDKGLQVVGISVRDEPGAPQKFMESKNYTYTLLLNGEAVAKDFKVEVFPTMYLIDKQGKIVHGERGLRESFEKEISVMIEEQLKK